MKTIVFPTDFSEDSIKALEFAIKYLSSEKTEFLVVHIFQMPSANVSGTFYLLEEIKKQSENDMKDFISDLNKKFQNIHFTGKVLQGDFNSQCNAVAIQNKADCIIMGTKGASGIKEVLLGSNTVSLVSGLQVPLFVIPFYYLNNKMKEFIYTYDGTTPASEAQVHLKKFANWFQLPVNAVHVTTLDNPEVKSWREVKTHFEGLEFKSEEIKGLELEDGLMEIIDENEGLLCLIHHKQSFWDKIFNTSDSRKLVMHANMPVLVIPE